MSDRGARAAAAARDLGFELPDELAIDTDVARRVIAERAGLASDSTAAPDAEGGFDLAPLERPVGVADDDRGLR